MNEKMEHTLRDRKYSYHIHHIKRVIKRIVSCEKSEI